MAALLPIKSIVVPRQRIVLVSRLGAESEIWALILCNALGVHGTDHVRAVRIEFAIVATREFRH